MYNYNYRKSSEPPLSTFYTAYPRDYLARSNSDAENVPFMRSPGPRPGGRKRLNTLEVTSANLTTFLQSTKRGKRKLSLLSNNGEEVLRFGETIREGKAFFCSTSNFHKTKIEIWLENLNLPIRLNAGFLDGQTLWVKIMTTYSANPAVWVKSKSVFV